MKPHLTTQLNDFEKRRLDKKNYHFHIQRLTTVKAIEEETTGKRAEDISRLWELSENLLKDASQR